MFFVKADGFMAVPPQPADLDILAPFLDSPSIIALIPFVTNGSSSMIKSFNGFPPLVF